MSDTLHVFVVEDDEELAELLCERLRTAGYRVSHTGDGADAIARIPEEQPDLVVLDVMLPGADGFTVCRRVRGAFEGGILMLTARDDDLDQIEGLELGADDYVVKPVRTRVLLARLEALARRVIAQRGPARADAIVLGTLSIDRARREVTIASQRVDLTTTEFDLLTYLAERVGTVVDREALYRDLAGIAYDGIDRAIDVHVSRIRHKLGDDPRDPRWIKTVRGVGYQLAEPR